MKSIVVSLAALSMSVLSLAPAQAQENTKVIALQYKLIDGAGHQRGDTTGVEESAEVAVGETVRIELVGTAIIDGVGEEVPIEANFDVAAGRGSVQLGRAGENWVEVSVKNAGEDGRAQIGFSVTSDYEMRGRNTSGRITLEIDGADDDADEEDGSSAAGGSAEELTNALYRAILNSRASRDDVERIRDEGYRGAVDVAAALAEEAESQGLGRSGRDRGYEAEDIRRVGTLYRGLLKRQDSDDDLWNDDGGFADNVRNLHRRGLEALVQTIVGSQEFQKVWGFGGSRRR